MPLSPLRGYWLGKEASSRAVGRPCASRLDTEDIIHQSIDQNVDVSHIDGSVQTRSASQADATLDGEASDVRRAENRVVSKATH